MKGIEIERSDLEIFKIIHAVDHSDMISVKSCQRPQQDVVCDGK